VPGRATVNLAGHAAKAADQQVPKVPATAIHGENIKVMQMDIAIDVRFAHVFGKQAVQPVRAVDGGKDMVVEPLERETHIRVLFDAPVQLFQVAIDQLVGVHQGTDIPQLVVQVAVEDICLGCLGMPIVNQRALDQVLYLLH